VSGVPRRVAIRFDDRLPAVCFGIERVERALDAVGIAHSAHPFRAGFPAPGVPTITVRRTIGEDDERYFADYEGVELDAVTDESFTITSAAGNVAVEAKTPRGLLYGCLELAERIAETGYPSGIEMSIAQDAALPIRGIKVNLPYAPYSGGEPFERNESVLWTMDYWAGFLEFLAEARYNLVTLWSEHPWHMLVTSPRFRDANHATDAQMAQRKAFFEQLLTRARELGIDVVLFTWNIALTADAEDALGIPPVHGMFRQYDIDAVRVRQHSPVVREYIEEMVYQTLVQYPSLRGIGTSASETIVGSGAERQQWVADVYGSAYERSGRRPWFIQRTNMQSAGQEVKQLIQPRFPPERFFVSWKYSMGHALSHPNPQFEALEGAWDGIDLTTTNVLYTVRNDDVHTHRWADADFIAAYVEGMRKPYVRGFYWGSDGYVFGRDFQHVDHGHKTWVWDFERHALQFQLWGRLSYDPSIASGLAERLLRPEHGEHAEAVGAGLAAASRIIPAVNRLAWRNYDYQWHPELCMTADGFRSVLSFVESEPMPGVGVVGISEWISAGESSPMEGETPAEILEVLRSSADFAEDAGESLLPVGGTTSCVALDLIGMASLGRYYAHKIAAALELLRFRATGDQKHAELARVELEAGVAAWEATGHAWAQHYRAFDMPRTRHTFGYLFYLEDVRHDIVLAEEYVESLRRDGVAIS